MERGEREAQVSNHKVRSLRHRADSDGSDRSREKTRRVKTSWIQLCSSNWATFTIYTWKLANFFHRKDFLKSVHTCEV